MRMVVMGVLAAGVAVGLGGCARDVPSLGRVARAGEALQARSLPVGGALRELYPVSVGTRWSYVLRQSHPGQALPERAMDLGIARAEARAGGVVEAVLERRYRGLQLPATRVLVRPDAVVLSRLADPIDGPSLAILRGVPAPGAAWGGRPLKPGNDERVMVIGLEDVAVPAGRWRAWRVDHALRYANGDGDVLSYWYAAGVGCVRMIERTTLYVGPEKRTLEVEGLLKAQVPGGWPPDLPGTAPSPVATVDPQGTEQGSRWLPVVP
ncbi:MAG: hypothetical protein VKQ33_07855 [Candidatus Sericytochromatia bacterium]|nr:hypothetical protein [Candidatus Sericytochromatia bacterium]